MLTMGKRKRTRTTVTPAQIKAFRESRKLTQGEAAELFDVSRTTWNLWESGKQIPSPQAALLFKALSKTKK